MADKIVSQAELLELLQEGAVLRRENKPTVIARFDDLIVQLKALVDSQKEQAAADLARSKTQLEVLASLQSLIRKSNIPKVQNELDLKPLLSVLAEIQEANAHRVPQAYEFEIQRDGRGYSNKIIANPIPRILN